MKKIKVVCRINEDGELEGWCSNGGGMGLLNDY